MENDLRKRFDILVAEIKELIPHETDTDAWIRFETAKREIEWIIYKYGNRA